jgi:hypothetical protein
VTIATADVTHATSDDAVADVTDTDQKQDGLESSLLC